MRKYTSVSCAREKRATFLSPPHRTVRFVTVFEKDKMIPPLNSAALFNCLRDVEGENWGSHGIMVPPGVQSSVDSGCYEGDSLLQQG